MLIIIIIIIIIIQIFELLLNYKNYILLNNQ